MQLFFVFPLRANESRLNSELLEERYQLRELGSVGWNGVDFHALHQELVAQALRVACVGILAHLRQHDLADLRFALFDCVLRWPVHDDIVNAKTLH